jgi:hypothetical protein
MYPTLLTVHGVVRWLVVVFVVAALLRFGWGLLRQRPWQRADERLAVVMMAIVDTQLLLGLTLWLVASPFAPGGGNTHAFFTFIHPIAMMAAVFVLHAGRAFARRSEHGRHARIVVALVVAVVLFAAAVPWPGTAWARPLLRVESLSGCATTRAA